MVLIAVAAVVYLVLSSITRHGVDHSASVMAPASTKSLPERYAFGYQPGLSYSEVREPCAAQYPQKKAFFGDLHVHTAVSADAFPDGTRTFPDDVYRFAKGEKIAVPTPQGQPQRMAQLTYPLDFAAVTDHAETFGEGYICRTEGAFPGYDSKSCQTFRAGGERGVRVFMTENAKVRPTRDKSVCGANNGDCLKAEKRVWDDMIRSAQTAYDTSSECSFTSFVGYEYTRSPNGQHLHRNTIFKNASVPERPASFFAHPSTDRLLQSLESECRLGIERCDVISIPHNSNISGGNAFNPNELDGFSATSQQALRELRNAYDRLMEITQHKGTSECLNGITDILGDVDELCEVEALRQFGKPERAIRLNTYLPAARNSNSPECNDDDMDAKDNLYKGFCLSSRDFARGALLEGMLEESRHAVNPYEFGFIGSSDTHIGVAGNVDEKDWAGHVAHESDLRGRLGEADLGRYNRLLANPGGLAGIYATENSRDALFQSMKRREAFATSGPRIEPRFFVGHFDENLCTEESWLQTAYQNGTPMGSKLPAQQGGFQFLAQAERDPQSAPLQKLQLIKGWLGPDGRKHNEVINLVQSQAGSNSLCAVYADHDYDPALASYYYVRAVEWPSARWSHVQCEALPQGERPPECKNTTPDSIHEMAWSSPIWLTPEDSSAPISVEPDIHTETFARKMISLSSVAKRTE